MREHSQIVDRFATEQGVDATALEAGRHALLDLGEGRRIGVERTPTHLLVHVSQARQYDASRYFLHALKRAHYARQAQWPVQVALQEHRGEPRVVALLRMELTSLDALRLDRMVAYLCSWLDSLDDD